MSDRLIIEAERHALVALRTLKHLYTKRATAVQELIDKIETQDPKPEGIQYGGDNPA